MASPEQPPEPLLSAIDQTDKSPTIFRVLNVIHKVVKSIDMVVFAPVYFPAALILTAMPSVQKVPADAAVNTPRSEIELQRDPAKSE